jgi:hypothetical protein
MTAAFLAVVPGLVAGRGGRTYDVPEVEDAVAAHHLRLSTHRREGSERGRPGRLRSSMYGLPPSAIVVDLGADTGTPTRRLVTAFGRVVAVDRPSETDESCECRNVPVPSIDTQSVCRWSPKHHASEGLLGLSLATVASSAIASRCVSRARYAAIAFAKLTAIARSRTSLALSGALAVGVGIPLLIATATGAIAIPHNDDWAYSRVALTLASEHKLRLVGWNQTNLIGHIIWAQPFLAIFGHSQPVLHAAQALAAATGLVTAYFVLRRFLSSGAALFATGLLATFPGYALLSTTFMSDTTAFAAQLGCLLSGLVALEGGRRAKPLLVVSLILGLFGFTIREIALAAPLAVLSARFVALPSARNRRETGALLVFIAAFSAAFEIWRHSLPGDQVAPFFSAFAGYHQWSEQLVRAFFTTAFAALPALVLVCGRLRRVLSRRSLIAALLALGVGALAVLHQPRGPFTLFTGNSLTRQGAVPVSLPGRQVLFPAAVWAAMTIAALAAGALLSAVFVESAEHAFRRARRGVPAHRLLLSAPPSKIVLAVYGVLSVLPLLLRAASGPGVLFDRYFWSAEIPLLVLVFSVLSPTRPPGGVARWLAATATMLLALVSLTLVAEDSTSSVARWNAGNAAVARGVSPVDVDAGLEWMGWHYPGVVGAQREPHRWRRPASWYNALEMPAAGNCILMSFSPRPERWLRLIEKRTYRPFVLWGRRELFVYQNGPACPASVNVALGL